MDRVITSNKKLPRIVVSAPKGRSGKTIVSIGLCSIFKYRGLVVQSFKKGPDYIDPSWLSIASGRPCRNLDFEIMPQNIMLKLFFSAVADSDLIVVEGAMGLYDSNNSDGRGSTAYLARLIQAPILLVVDSERMTRSVAALVSGFRMFESGTNIAGVILNNISGLRHEKKLKDAIERYCDIPIVGYIKRDERLTIAQRHLGIVPRVEVSDYEALLEGIRALVEPNLDVKTIINIANSAGKIQNVRMSKTVSKHHSVTIGVVRDSVFSFYYPENLEALENSGARLIFIDSLHDTKLPKLNGLYIGGGFPELFLHELEENSGLRKDIAFSIKEGLPVYAECAGLMYLCRSIRWKGKRYEMVGEIPADVDMCERPQGHGYVIAEVCAKNPFFPVGEILHGHEFHHSRLINVENLNFVYRLQRGSGIIGNMDAISFKNVLATYTHLHTLGSPRWAESFVNLAINAKERDRSMVVTNKI
jgi:cobyrinic acid a,c-diamide synthase